MDEYLIIMKKKTFKLYDDTEGFRKLWIMQLSCDIMRDNIFFGHEFY